MYYILHILYIYIMSYFNKRYDVAEYTTYSNVSSHTMVFFISPKTFVALVTINKNADSSITPSLSLSLFFPHQL